MLLMAYREAGGKYAVVLFHDAPHGGELIDALARFGAGAACQCAARKR